MAGRSDRERFKMVTPEFRGSYVHLAKAHAFKEGDDAKYGLNIVLAQDDPFWEELEKLTDEAAEMKWGEVPDDLEITVKDGDEMTRRGKRKWPIEWEGCFSVPAADERRPGIIDSDFKDILNLKEECYSGAWYRATVVVAAWEYGPRKGVSLFLDNVMKVKDDDAYGRQRASAADDFAKHVDRSGRKSRDREDDDDEAPRPRRRNRGNSRKRPAASEEDDILG